VIRKTLPCARNASTACSIDSARTYVNGAPYAGDPSKLVLIKHLEVAIVVGKPPKKIPSSYAFGRL